MLGETRTERAERLRAPIQELVNRSSLQQALDAITAVSGNRLSIGAIRSLLDGGIPREPTLQTFEAWARRVGALSSEPSQPRIPSRPIWLDAPTVGTKIREIRKQVGLSQKQLAEHVGSPNSQAEVSRWERGHTRPGYEILESIARLIGQHAEIFQEGDAGQDTSVAREEGQGVAGLESSGSAPVPHAGQAPLVRWNAPDVSFVCAPRI